MTNAVDADRTDPPLTGDELTTLRGFLDFHRDTLRLKTTGLTSSQLATPLAHHPSEITLGGLLKHLAWVESFWFSEILSDGEPVPPFGTVDWSADSDWDWHSAAQDSADQLRELFESAVSTSDEVLDHAVTSGQLDQYSARAPWPDGRHPSLRWILVHMVEEYARHNGHADLLREAIDGQTGQ